MGQILILLRSHLPIRQNNVTFRVSLLNQKALLREDPGNVKLRVNLSIQKQALGQQVVGVVEITLAHGDVAAQGATVSQVKRVAPEDLGDPALLDESRRALDELTRILRLPPVYPFQR